MFGRPVDANDQKRVGYMPQELALFTELTVNEILVYYGSLHKLKNNELNDSIESILKLLEVNYKNRLISQLSGGQQRLVSIAITMIHKPALIILDEPTVGVDSMLRKKIWDYLYKCCHKNGIKIN